STTATPGNHTLRAIARDAANNTSTSTTVTVTVPDTTAPTVTRSEQPRVAKVSGPVPASANATDNVGVAGVQLQLDGAPLGAEDTTAPYALSWDSTTATPGNHTLRAIARDAANNTGTSTTVTVTVPDTTAPTVT